MENAIAKMDRAIVEAVQALDELEKSVNKLVEALDELDNYEDSMRQDAGDFAKWTTARKQIVDAIEALERLV